MQTRIDFPFRFATGSLTGWFRLDSAIDPLDRDINSYSRRSRGPSIRRFAKSSTRLIIYIVRPICITKWNVSRLIASALYHRAWNNLVAKRKFEIAPVTFIYRDFQQTWNNPLIKNFVFTGTKSEESLKGKWCGIIYSFVK